MSGKGRRRGAGGKAKPQAPAARGPAPAPRPALQAAGPAFSALTAGLQRKVAVGKADGPLEREAEAVADRVMQGAPAPAISRLPAGGLGAAAQRAAAEEEMARGESVTEEEEEVQAQAVDEEEEEVQAQADEEEVQAQAVGEDEEEEVEAVGEDEEEEVQAQAVEEAEEEDEEVQAQAVEEAEEEEVQAKSAGRSRRDGREPTAADLRSPGPGRALPFDVRSRIERSVGSDLSDVRVHDDERARQAAAGLRARAFAHGRDIWLGPGESPRDTRLMAHEAAHVVQQTGGQAARAGGATAAPATVAQRAETTPPGGGSPGPLPTRLDLDDGTAANLGANKALTIPEISLPTAANKQRTASPLVARPPASRPSDQRKKWQDEIETDGQALQRVLPDSKAVARPGGEATEDGRFFLKIKNQKSFVIGTREQIAGQARIPNWQTDGNNERFEVDHVQEWQIGGGHDMGNFQLLNAECNRAAGNAIRGEIKERIETAAQGLLAAAPIPAEGQADPYAPLRQPADAIRRDFSKVEFTKQASTPLQLQVPRENLWLPDDIKDAKHIEKLQVLGDAEINQYKLLGSPTEVKIYLGRGGSAPRSIPWTEDGPAGGRVRPPWPKGFHMVGVEHDSGIPTEIHAEVYRNNRLVRGSAVRVPLTKLAGEQYTLQMPTDFRASLAEKVSLTTMSPIEVETSFLDEEALITRGKLRPTPQIFKRDVAIDIEIEGDEVRLSKTFTSGEFDIPGPVKITDTALTLSAGAGRGGPSLSVDGELNFEIERVGKGQLKGMGSTARGFAVKGFFDFDPALFKGADARIELQYADDKFSGQGTLKIGDGQITGIRSAQLAVKVEDEVWTASGTVEPKIPGVKEGSLEMTFDPDGGFEIAGKLTLGADIPRMKGGSLDARLKKEGDSYLVSAKGSAEFDIPGANPRVEAEYHDGLFRAEGRIEYRRGLASGMISVGVTNMPVDPEAGRPSGGEPGERLTVYGAGSVTVRFTPWLQGTAGIVIKPDGQIEVRGEVALPNKIEVFPEKSLDKQLFSLGVDIPIVGVSVARKRIGIFLNITGKLSAKASIGPGTLEEVSVAVTYNPEDESAAKITGSARFVVPAEAGLRLAIQGAIGAGIPVVSARAGIEVGGEVGVEGRASAAATVEWTPASGLSMEAPIEVSAQPKFAFDISGFVDVVADLWVKEIELYSKRWQLASFEYGPAMRVGAILKVVVENNQVKPISMNDIEFIRPEIDPIAMAKGLIKRIA